MDFLTFVFRRAAIWGLLLLVVLPWKAPAQLSPGKLALGHEQLEGLNNCSKCHDSKVSGGANPMLCRACHEAIDTRMKMKKGLHGLEDFNKCGKCHPDHIGRAFKLVNWRGVGETQAKFQHDKTGYKLEGAHAELKCEKCHTPNLIKDPKILGKNAAFQKRTFLGLGTECLSCHKDTHGKMFADKACLDCHTMSKWKPAKGFNHNKDTQYEIKGKHIGLECSKCHTKGQPWELKPSQRIKDAGCITCHKDIHKGKFGRNCNQCHQETGFNKIKMGNFDHSKTLFPLDGKHAEVNCNECHKQGSSWVLTRYKKCIDCHKDFHVGEFAKTTDSKKCEDCHSVEGYVPAYYGVIEHNKTRFPLKDAHLATPCAACHTSKVKQNEVVARKFKFTSLECVTCHDDPHRKQMDKYKTDKGCLSCHSSASWKSIQFDHKLTGYELTGRHFKVQCNDCHAKTFDFKTRSGTPLKIPDFSVNKKQCFECHEDKHQGQFKEKSEKDGRLVVKCDKCHTTTDWFAELFVHNTQSRFKLDGAHEKARCNACHATQTSAGKSFVRYKPLGMECRACHGDSVMVK